MCTWMGNKKEENESEIFKGRERSKLTGLLYVDDLVLYGEAGENLRRAIRYFFYHCRRKGLKLKENKSKWC